jgi:methionine synthase II (cobalamin-independent)
MPITDPQASEDASDGEIASNHSLTMTAGEVFEVVGDHLGELAPRIPDGDQAGWVIAMYKTLPANESLEPAGTVPLHDKSDWELPMFKLKDDAKADLKFGPYGYIKVAEDSYADFVRTREAGKVPEGTRFQVTFPAPTSAMVTLMGDWEDIFPAADEAMAAEIAGVVAAVPAEDLTVQLDVCHQVVAEESLRHPGAANINYHSLRPPASFEDDIASVANVANQVPEGVELGIHLCYGNPDGMHLIEPADMSVLKDFANALTKAIKRPIAYIHMPVPIARNDDAYFAPLADLELDKDTKLNLGLIHLKDGTEGAQKRIAIASKYVTDFGISGECGFSTVKRENLEPLLDLHKEVATIG